MLPDSEKSKNFVYPEDQDVTADAFGKFVAGVLDGSIAPTVKSEVLSGGYFVLLQACSHLPRAACVARTREQR